jgi:hypothetical protein
VNDAFVIMSGTFPVFMTVSACAVLVLPTSTLPNEASEPGALICAPTPRPVTGMVKLASAASGSLVVMLMLMFTSPGAVGANATSKLRVAPGATVHPAVQALSEYTGEASDAVKLSVWVPVLPIVTVLVGGVDGLTATSPNATEVVTRLTSGVPASHVRSATLSPPASESLVNVTVAVCMPIAPVGGWQRTLRVLFGGTSALRLHDVVVWQPLIPVVMNENQPLPPASVAVMTRSGPWFVVTEFETVMVPVPVSPGATMPKLAAVTSVTAITALVPMPVSVAVTSGMSLVTRSVVVRVPTADGLNTTSTVAVSFGASVVAEGVPTA